MAWLLGAGIVALVLILLAKGGRSAGDVRQQTQSAQRRANFLPDSEKEALSAEVRALALQQYDMASAKAQETGKEGAFAHQVGVMRAVSAVLAHGAPSNSAGEQELRMETVPFNGLPAEEGRRAVAEYLVYKFFPENADERAFSPALAAFHNKLLGDAESQPDPDQFLFNMVYCARYDWQRYIAATRSASQ